MYRVGINLHLKSSQTNYAAEVQPDLIDGKIFHLTAEFRDLQHCVGGETTEIHHITVTTRLLVLTICTNRYQVLSI